ncbi:MAG TPA: hypothetical protein VHX88_03520, partial [Solirubrobacteraceae bacterium]|nr:hypothetical protein [Solirubrobacteraceae bacterium]
MPAPLALLVVLSVLSLGARAAWLGYPCRSACREAAAHRLTLDEFYSGNAARVIAGIHPPAGESHASAPLGQDANSEHPQLVKLIIAGPTELLGDGPFAWRPDRRLDRDPRHVGARPPRAPACLAERVTTHGARDHRLNPDVHRAARRDGPHRAAYDRSTESKMTSRVEGLVGSAGFGEGFEGDLV